MPALTQCRTRSVAAIALALFALFSCANPAPGDEALAPTAFALGEEFAAVAERVSPAVVHLSTQRVVERERPGRRREPERPSPFPFPMPDEPRRQEGLGSGVIVRPDGFILTNYHLVANTSNVRVLLTDGREFEAETVGIDQETDIAVLKIDADDLPTVTLGKDDDIRVGQYVLAIGSPFGLARSVTGGIVSATGRDRVGITEFENFIQTDAAINPGNSGGPLVNMHGRVIGISTAIFSRTGAHAGIGFAVPADMASAIMEQIIERGYVTRGWLGVSIQDMTAELAEAIGAEKTDGALVAQVIEGTPAKQAGLKEGDLIVAVDGEEVQDSMGLRNRIAQFAPGTEITLTLVREGQERTLTATLGERPSPGRPVAAAEAPAFGFEVDEITDELRERYEIDVDRGVVVTSVDENTNAWRAGLRPGTVVTQVNRRPVRSVQDFKDRLDTMDEGENLLLLIRFRGASSYMLIKPEEGR